MTQILPEGFEIRRATPEEILEIGSADREPQLVARIGHELDAAAELYICTAGAYKLLFEFWSIGTYTYEIHVAVPKNSTIACRALILGGLRWVFEVGAPDCAILLTSCPGTGRTKISNMLEKLGWTDVSAYATASERASGRRFFIFKRSQILQH